MYRYIYCEYVWSNTATKTSTDQQWNGYQNHARIQDRRSMCLQHTEHFDLILLHLGISNTSAYL